MNEKPSAAVIVDGGFVPVSTTQGVGGALVQQELSPGEGRSSPT